MKTTEIASRGMSVATATVRPVTMFDLSLPATAGAVRVEEGA
ncbi:hypothetical protein [Microbispora sp. H10830]|nr:hypothetical protein [Microbispora sp. H10830]